MNLNVGPRAQELALRKIINFSDSLTSDNRSCNEWKP